MAQNLSHAMAALCPGGPLGSPPRHGSKQVYAGLRLQHRGAQAPRAPGEIAPRRELLLPEPDAPLLARDKDLPADVAQFILGVGLRGEIVGVGQRADPPLCPSPVHGSLPFRVGHQGMEVNAHTLRCHICKTGPKASSRMSVQSSGLSAAPCLHPLWIGARSPAMPIKRGAMSLADASLHDSLDVALQRPPDERIVYGAEGAREVCLQEPYPFPSRRLLGSRMGHQE